MPEYNGEVVTAQEYTGPVEYTGKVIDNRARDNLNTTLNVAGFDTHIPINPELSAYLTTLGGRMSGSYRGVKQFLGMGDEAQNEAALTKLQQDPEVGGYAKAGNIIGAGLDPVTLALPVSRGKSLIDMAKAGAIGGAASGAMQPVESGGSRAVNTAIGGAAGGLLSPAIGAAITRGRMPLRTPQSAPAAPPQTGGIGLAEPAPPVPDLTDSTVPIQEVIARRRAEFGGINPQLAVQTGGAAVGATTGALTADENASPTEIASRALIGGAAGWQLTKMGAGKIGAYRPTVPEAAVKAPQAVNVVGDAAEPLFKTQVSPATTKNIAEIAKDFFEQNPGLRDPSRLISDDIHRYVAGGAVSEELLAKHNLTGDQFATVWRNSISDHARSLGYLAHVMRDAQKNMTPEEIAAVRAAGGNLEDSAYVRPFWKKLTDTWRGLLVTQPVTAVRNAITQVGRVGLDVVQAPIDHWLQRLTGRPVTTQPLDGVEEVISLFSRNKATTDKIMQAFPKERDRLFQNYLSDVPTATGIEGKVWNAIDTGVGALNVLNRTQEFIIRRGIFQNALDKELRTRGQDLQTIIKSNNIGAIPDEAVKAAVQTSLNKTFGESPAWGSAPHKVIDAINAIPGANLAIPFPRFMYNAIRFQYQYSPAGILSYLSPAERASFANGDVSTISKAMIGTSLFGTAALFRNSEYAGEKWYEAVNDKGEVIDLRPFNPFVSYLFAADLLKKSKEGTLYKLTGNDIAQGLLSTNMRAGTGLYLLDSALNLMSKSADEKKFSTKAQEFTGDLLGGFVTPLATLRDAYDQITEGQSITRDTRQEPLLGPSKSRIPGVSQGMPEAELPTREGPRVTQDPLVRQATGMTKSGPKNALEKELDRLGFDRREVLPSTGDRELDREYTHVMGAAAERFLVPVVESEHFKELSDASKGVVLSELLEEIRHEVKTGVNAGQPPEKQIQMEIRKQPPRLRYLLKEMGVLQE